MWTFTPRNIWDKIGVWGNCRSNRKPSPILCNSWPLSVCDANGFFFMRPSDWFPEESEFNSQISPGRVLLFHGTAPWSLRDAAVTSEGSYGWSVRTRRTRGGRELVLLRSARTPCHREVSDALLTEDGYADAWLVLVFPTLYHSLLEALLTQLEWEGCKNVSRCTSTSRKYQTWPLFAQSPKTFM